MNKVTFPSSSSTTTVSLPHASLHPLLFLLFFISPSIHPLFLELRDAKGQWSHEVIAAGQVPVPHLHWQTAVLIVFFQVAAREGRTNNSWWLRVITVGVVIVKGLSFKDTREQCWIHSFSSSTFIPGIIPLIRYQESFPSFFCAYFFLSFRHIDRNDSNSEWTSALPQ